MVKKKKKKKNNNNEKYGGTGYEFRQMFCSPQPRGFMTYNKHETARFRLLVRDDKELSDPIDRSPVRSGSRFCNDIHNRGQILYESYYRNSRYLHNYVSGYILGIQLLSL